jgi:hypothetical protein
VTVVRWALELVLQAGVSLRGTAAALALTVQQLGLELATPAATTVRSWLLRLGCFALTRPLPTDTPWLWLIDHTLQIGAVKLLVILGCPLRRVPFGARALALADLQLLAVVPMEESNGPAVAAVLEQTVVRTGVPRQIGSDQGTDLNAGVALFQQQHPGTAHVHDLAHQAANVLKQRWQKDEAWTSFLQQLAQTGAKVRQTRVAHLLPPTPRPKARFMNVGPVLRFAGRVLRLLDQPASSVAVAQRYGWLRAYREAVVGWTCEHAVVQIALQQVRQHGVSRESAAALDAAWAELTWTPGARDVAARLRASVRREGEQARTGERLVGSTEVLESAFGKLKRLEGSYAEDGFTGLVLSLGAMTSTWSEAEVAAALAAVPKKKAEGWVDRVLGKSVQWFRRLFVEDTNV